MQDTWQLVVQNSLCPALGTRLICLSQLITAPHLCHSYPVVALLHGGCGACVVALYESGWQVALWPSSCCQKSGFLLRCCLSKCQQGPLQLPLGYALGPGHLGIPRLSFFPGPGLPRSSAEAWSEWGWSVHLAQAEACGKVVKGNPEFAKADLCPPCFRDKPTCAPHEQSPGFFRLLGCPCGPPTCQEGLSSLCRTPGVGHLVCGSTCSLPRVGVHWCDLSFPLSPFPGSQVPTQSLFFPFHLVTCVSFL